MPKMENRHKKRTVDKDRISNLPGNIIDQILMRLPIMDAARTSVLSKNWKYKFTELPFITINGYDLPAYEEEKEFVSTVDHILFLHIGPILKLRISASIDDYKALDRWIIYLSRSNTKEFELRLCYNGFDDGYQPPSCFYAWKSLTTLVFADLSLKLPSAFTGFTNLKSLKLQTVDIEPAEFENLISKCPVLECLTAEFFWLTKPVKINAPNLQFLSGNYFGISFENTSHLAEVILRGLQTWYDDHYLNYDSSNLVNFLVHLPKIQRLDIDIYFLQYLVPFIKCCKPSMSFVTLEYLAIEVDLRNHEDCLRALCFFKISPNVTKLKFSIGRDIDPNEPKEFFWEDDGCNFVFTKLQFVEITGSNFSGQELSFVRFVLSNSPVLEKMVINPGSEQIGREFLKDLLSLHRVSTARIICLD